MHESVVRVLRDVSQVVRVACIGQGVQVGNLIIGALGEQETDQVGTDEPTAAGYEHVLKHRMRNRKKRKAEFRRWLAAS